jgi:hypothetical protein
MQMNRKIFLSYKYSGLTLKELHDLIDPIMLIMKNRGFDIYCNLYDDVYYTENKMDTKQIMDHALDKLEKECNYQIILWDTGYSEGSMIEFGFAYRKMSQLLLINNSVKSTTLRSLASHIITYENHEELYHILESYAIQ